MRELKPIGLVIALLCAVALGQTMPATAPATSPATMPATAPATSTAPASAPAPLALKDMTVAQLADEYARKRGQPASEDAWKELSKRGDGVYDELLAMYHAHKAGWGAAAVALTRFPQFADDLIKDASGPNAARVHIQLLQMGMSAAPAMVRGLASADEKVREAALAALLPIGRQNPDEIDLKFTAILTAPAEVKPRLITAQGLVTGLWPRETQEAAVQQLAHGDPGMIKALLAAVDCNGLSLDEAAEPWTAELQAAKAPLVIAHLLHAARALRTEDVSKAAPAILAATKTLCTDEAQAQGPEAADGLQEGIAALARGGNKSVTAELPPLLKSKTRREQWMAIELCRQMGDDAAPLMRTLADLLDAADTPVEVKSAALAALAAMGPAAKGATVSIQKISDPALAGAKKHAVLMLQEGWNSPPLAPWKPVKTRRVKFVPRATVEADLSGASEAVEALRADAAANPGAVSQEITVVGVWRMMALAGDAPAAMKFTNARGTGPATPFVHAQEWAYGAAAMLHSGKRDRATEDLIHAIGRYRLGLMMGQRPPPDLDFACVAIAQIATGDLEGAVALSEAVPLDRAKIVQWQMAHLDFDGAMETAMETPYGQERINALAAAGNALGAAGRVPDAAKMFQLALDAMHAKKGLGEQELADMVGAVATFSDAGVTPAMLRGFYDPDDRDLSVAPRMAAIGRMVGRGLLEGALQLAISAPPADPDEDAAVRMSRLQTYLSPALAMGAGARKPEVMALCDRFKKELDAQFDASAKRPAGRDAVLYGTYFQTVAYLSQIYLNAGQGQNSTAMLNTAATRMADARTALGGNFDTLACALVRQMSATRNAAGAAALADKMDVGFNKVVAWCAVAEAQYPQDKAGAERSWKQAVSAGAAPAIAAQTGFNVNTSRNRAKMNAPPVPGIQVITAQQMGLPAPAPTTQPALPGLKAVEDAARRTNDAAARIELVWGFVKQVENTWPVGQWATERRLPMEYALLMKDAESKLGGTTLGVLQSRGKAFDTCLSAGMVENMEGRVPGFAAAVMALVDPAGAKAAATMPATAPAVPAEVTPELRGLLKTLAGMQGATGRAAEAKKWIDGVADAALRMQLRYAVLRGAILRVSDVVLGMAEVP